jgi:hypothetical protein
MNDSLIHSCDKLRAKEKKTENLVLRRNWREMPQATNLGVPFLIQLKSYGFAIFHIVRMKWVVINIFYIETFQIFIKF